MAKKVEHKHELLENPEALKEKLVGAETWLERNPKTSIGIAVAILLIVGGFFGFQYYKGTLEQEARVAMFQAEYYFEQDSLTQALEGDGNNLGFKAIIEEYGITDAANLASYYAGVSYLKLGEFKLGRLYLEDFNSSDLLVQARAYCLIGDTYMEEEKYADAATYYGKAADYKSNKYFSPGYLMKQALAYEKLNDVEKAKEVYDKILADYVGTTEYQNARKLKAKLDSNS
jgi:tetratricopeptide (TPR) repeat protein